MQRHFVCKQKKLILTTAWTLCNSSRCSISCSVNALELFASKLSHLSENLYPAFIHEVEFKVTCKQNSKFLGYINILIKKCVDFQCSNIIYLESWAITLIRKRVFNKKLKVEEKKCIKNSHYLCKNSFTVSRVFFKMRYNPCCHQNQNT